jgi:2-hydroxychromene-2-carboxylate isomerase
VVAAETGKAGAYLAAVFAALFADNRDIRERAVVEAVAGEAGLDAESFAARIGDPATELQVNRNGAELFARGGFGTPTLLVGTDLYFGNDRLPLVEAALARQGGMRLTLPGAHGA